MKIFIKTVLLMSLFITAQKAANSTEYYLSPSDDWFSVISGSNLQPGDEVVLSEGTYSDGRRLSISHQGTAAFPIVIRSEQGSMAVITRPNANQNVINIEGAEYLVFQGIEVTGGSIGIRIGGKNIAGGRRQSKFITIKDSLVHHVGGAAVTANFTGDTNVGHQFLRNEIHHTSGSGEGFYLGRNNDGSGNTTSIFRDGVIEGNYIHHLNGSNISQGDGIEIKDGSYNNIVKDNVIHDTKFPGILVYGTDGNMPNIIEGNVIWSSGDNGIQASADAVITNNIVIDSNASGISSQNHQSAVPGNLIIAHNTIISSGGRVAVRVNYPSGGVLSGPVVIANNALYSMDSGLALRLQDISGFTVSDNVGVGGAQPSQNINAWNPSGNPDLDFNDWTNKDVFPAENSLLIGNADANYLVSQDFNQNDRLDSLDVGAYLFNANGNSGWLTQAGFKTVLLDTDQDGVQDSQDNCINIANPDQRDTDGDGYGNLCDGDLNNDGNVSVGDLQVFRTRFGTTDSDADFDGNGWVSIGDLNIFRSLFGHPPG
jgi:hypothetical protein